MGQRYSRVTSAVKGGVQYINRIVYSGQSWIFTARIAPWYQFRFKILTGHIHRSGELFLKLEAVNSRSKISERL